MKILILALFIFVQVPAHSITMEVIGKKGEVLFQGQKEFSLPTHVGFVTTQVFKENQIPFEGGEYGISSIYGLGQNMDVISSEEMKAYGWCFALNGHVPETMADATAILKNDDSLRWYYAFAHYKKGGWISQCEQD